MKLEIKELDKRGERKVYRIITPVDVLKEEELRYQKQVMELTEGGYCSFEKGKNPEFPNTWFLYVTQQFTEPNIID